MILGVRKGAFRGVLALVVAAGPWLEAAERPGHAPPVRIGTERASFSYVDPLAAPKAVLLKQINADRKAHGAPPLQLEPRAASVGDTFCRALLEQGALSHFDAAGRPPYLRWTLAGGIDYHSENVGAYTSGGTALDRPLEQVLLSVHASMMAEIPPEDGHRRTLLDRDFTHVGIGVAVSGGSVRLCEEFTTRVIDWVSVPGAPLPAGAVATVQAQPSPGWEVPWVEVAYEPASKGTQRAGSSYSYPPAVLNLVPELATGFGVPYSTSVDGVYAVSPAGRVTVQLPLSAGPGHYYVICHSRRKGMKQAAPATVIRIDAQ
jgi:hypothetical protein